MSNIASYEDFKQKVIEGYKRMSKIADDSDLINITAMNQYNRERLIHSGTMIPLDEDGNALIHAGTLYGKEYVHVEPNYYGEGQPRYWYDQQAYDNWVKAGRPGPGASGIQKTVNQGLNDLKTKMSVATNMAAGVNPMSLNSKGAQGTAQRSSELNLIRQQHEAKKNQNQSPLMNTAKNIANQNQSTQQNTSQNTNAWDYNKVNRADNSNVQSEIDKPNYTMRSNAANQDQQMASERAAYDKQKAEEKAAADAQAARYKLQSGSADYERRRYEEAANIKAQKEAAANAQKTAQSQGSAAANAQKYIDLTRQSPKTAVDQYIKDNSDITNALNVLKSAIKSGKATLGKGSFNTSNATVQSVMDQLESKAQKDGNSIGGRNGAFYKELSTRIYNELKNAQSEHNSSGDYTERSSAAQQDRYAADDRLQYERQKAREARDKANPNFRSNSADQAAYEETARENYEKLHNTSENLSAALRKNIKLDDPTKQRELDQRISQDQEQERILKDQVDAANAGLRDALSHPAEWAVNTTKYNGKLVDRAQFNSLLKSKLEERGITLQDKDGQVGYKNPENAPSAKSGAQKRLEESMEKHSNNSSDFWNVNDAIEGEKNAHEAVRNKYEDKLYATAEVLNAAQEAFNELTGDNTTDFSKIYGESRGSAWALLKSYMSRLKHSAIEEPLTPQEEFELFKQKVEAGKIALDNYRNGIIVHGGIAEYATELKKKSILN